MAHATRQKRTHHRRATNRPLASAVAALTLLAPTAVPAAPAPQQPSGPGLSYAGQPGVGNPAEAAAYAAALSQTDPRAKLFALQQFLAQYPTSPLHQTAVEQMRLARGDLRATGATPPQPPKQSQPPAPAQNLTQTINQPWNPSGSSNLGATTPRDSLLQHPAKPAEVVARPGSLAIKTDNSSLAQILEQISAATGMKIEGLGQDERIFGDYGPGDPRQVLLSLLEGSGYNVLMVGDDKGAPRELTLSPRSSEKTVAAAAPARNAREPEDDEIEQEQPQAPPEQPIQPAGNQESPPQVPRNPAEFQQEMMRLRQQQQQQQQPQ
jgi:hypothetical protein